MAAKLKLRSKKFVKLLVVTSVVVYIPCVLTSFFVTFFKNLFLIRMTAIRTGGTYLFISVFTELSCSFSNRYQFS